MAEYVTVMLANSKSGSQITAELADLIGPEYDAAFTDWIFDSAIPEHYVKASSTAGAGSGSGPGPAAAPAASLNGRNPQDSAAQATTTTTAAAPAEQIQTVGDSREGNYNSRPRHGLPSRPAGGGGVGNGPRGRDASNSQQQQQQRGGGPGGVFGTAMAGLKREHDGSNPNGMQRDRRPRMSGENEHQQNNSGERSIFDRAGVRAGTAQPNNFTNMGGPFANGRGGPPRRGAAGGFGQQQPPQIPGLPPLHIPDNFNSLPSAQQQAIQQQIFQHQLIAAAAAQQMYSGGGGGGGPQLMGMQQQPPFSGPLGAMHVQNGQQQNSPMFGQQQQQQQQQRPPKPVKLPPRPTSEELCKYGVECKNAICRYSHPSPAATKESGLVLNKEGCEKGIDCDDKVNFRVIYSMKLL